MKETVVIAIISASLSALINCIFHLINKGIDNSKERKKAEEEKLAAYIEKKEKVYIAAIERLLQIERGFSYTREMVDYSEKIQEKIDSDNMAFAKISPQLRLYSTDKIFNKYTTLAYYTRFAYASQNGPRLMEEDKWAFDIQITLLSRLMQEDLGYRKYNPDLDTSVCPECGCEHDIISKCPQCKMSYNDLVKKSQEILKQMKEMGDEV